MGTISSNLNSRGENSKKSPQSPPESPPAVQYGGTKKRKRRWSNKYKKSINCRRPKGFSQKQYCKYGRKTKKTRKNKKRIIKKLKTSYMRVGRKTSFRNSLSRKKIKKKGGAAMEHNPQEIEYNGKVNFSGNELEYMKASIGTVLTSIDPITQMDDNVFRIGDVVIKALPYDEYSLRTCELIIRASEEGVGVKFLNYIVVKNNGVGKRVYLFTEFLPLIKKNIDIEKIQNFAEEISKTSLLFHPDFWYENICLDKEGKLKAIDWDSYMYYETNYEMNEYIDKPDIAIKDKRDNAIKIMMKRYRYKLNDTKDH